MKVYYWQGIRRGAQVGLERPLVTTREIVCTNSKRDARALQGGMRVPLSEIHESRQATEIATASARPGTIFWRKLDSRDGTWTAVEP